MFVRARSPFFWIANAGAAGCWGAVVVFAAGWGGVLAERRGWRKGHLLVDVSRGCIVEC